MTVPYLIAAALLCALVPAAAGQVYKQVLTVAVDALPVTPKNGTEAFVTNCRAIVGVGALGGGFLTQSAGAGTGCLATYNANASAPGWYIAGTTQAVTQ